jgi:hypothetical protein
MGDSAGWIDQKIATPFVPVRLAAGAAASP